MDLLRFAGAAMVAALLVLWADPFAGAWFLALSSRVVGHFAFQLFSWACMFGAVMLATPARRYWATALMCALALTVALYLAMTFAAISNLFSELYLYWMAALALFALQLWPVWRWYDGLVRALADR